MPTVCFTGHRKLNGNWYDRHKPSAEWHTLKGYMDSLTHWLMKELAADTFISGLAIGVDMLAVESVAYSRSFMPNDIRLIGAMPFPSQPNRWPAKTREHWDHVCSLCNSVVSVSADPYSPAKMQVRNQWMVDRADYVIAVHEGMESGGTWNCMKYAWSKGKQVLHVYRNGVAWNCKWVKE